MIHDYETVIVNRTTIHRENAPFIPCGYTADLHFYCIVSVDHLIKMRRYPCVQSLYP